MTEEMKRIGTLIRTQDNLGTDAPMWIVQQRRQDFGFRSDYAENFKWGDCDGELDDEEAAQLESLYQAGQEIPKDWKGYRRVGYKNRWEFVTACFTKKGCEDYIASNGHNLCEPRIYADSSYRNEEFKQVRKFLMELT